MHFKFCVAVVLFLISFVNETSCFHYLLVTPCVVKSIHGLMTTVVSALANNGHEVTFVTPFTFRKEHPNVTVIISPNLHDALENESIFEMQSTIRTAKVLGEMNMKSVDRFWSEEDIRNLWNKRYEFDAFITLSYLNEVVFPFLVGFQGPFIQICTPGVEYYSISREGNWLSPSIVPSILLNFDDHMTFIERVINLPGAIFFYFLQNRSIQPVQENIEKYFPEIGNLMSYYDRVSLTLINGNFALDGPVPLLPSQVEIGTINAKKPQPLPEDLEKFMQGSGDAGVIYFSLGSIAKSTDIPKEAKATFLEAFRRVPQRVVWKYEGKDLDLPPNVMTQSWMPQQDILGHPKTRVFISHCGNLGTQEAKYHGVPVLGVPIAFDQPRNAARMERKGQAVVIQWSEMTADNIVEALDRLINDTSYAERLKTLSNVLQDQKETPAERAVWWLEYVVRHKGAPHLRYAGQRLSLFQYIMLDVLLFWFAVFGAIILLIVYSIKLLCCRGKKIKTKGDNKLKKK